MTVQHGSLSAERWAEFTFDRQILMIGNEMNRAGKLMASSAQIPFVLGSSAAPRGITRPPVSGPEKPRS